MSQIHDFSFGSKAWQEYYRGRNKDGARPASDLAHKQRKAFKRLETKAGQREFDDLRNEELRLENETWGDMALFDSWPDAWAYSKG
jgi:hypothetical protein